MAAGRPGASCSRFTPKIAGPEGEMVRRGSGSARRARTSTRRPVSAPGCAEAGIVTSKRGAWDAMGWGRAAPASVAAPRANRTGRIMGAIGRASLLPPEDPERHREGDNEPGRYDGKLGPHLRQRRALEHVGAKRVVHGGERKRLD